MSEPQREPLFTALPAVIADLLAIAGLFWLVPLLASRLARPSGINALLLGVLYVIFCAGVFLLRRLEPAPLGNDRLLPPAVRGLLAAFFGLVAVTAIAWQLGFFESLRLLDVRELGEGGTAVYFAFAPGAWLGFSMLYILILAFPITPTVRYTGRRYWPAALAGLIAANSLLVFAVAQAAAVLPPGAGLLSGLAVIGLLLLLFGPPRLLFVTRSLGLGRQSWPAILSFVLLLLVGTWQSLNL